MSGFRKASRRRSRAEPRTAEGAGPVVVVGTFAPIEVALLRQFMAELMLLLEAEVGAHPADPPPLANADERDDGTTATATEPSLQVDSSGSLTDASVDDVFAALTGMGEERSEQVPPIGPPLDPVIARLLPDAYQDDPDSAGDFRRFTQDRLVAGKYAAVSAVLEALPEPLGDDSIELPLDADQANQWLRAINDVRLALGTRLQVEQDDDERWAALSEDDPLGRVHEIYQWLGWVQETLVDALH